MSGESDLLKQIQRLLAELRSEKRRLHDRHVGVGDLLNDRFEIAREYGFGEGTSCYDNVLILGEVRVGRNCWIGPNVILDGSGGLAIGDHVDIGAGVQIYSHDTVRRVLSGGIEPVDHARTEIGSRVYIGPQAVIAKGVRIGDGVVIGAMSFVNADVAEGAKVFGIPARPA
jgi:acetyltransferase-like isoleucine patch superfamily enzyme